MSGCGFAAGCEAGLCPWFGLCPKSRLGQSPYQGRSPIMNRGKTGGAEPRLTSGGEAAPIALRIAPVPLRIPQGSSSAATAKISAN